MQIKLREFSFLIYGLGKNPKLVAHTLVVAVGNNYCPTLLEVMINGTTPEKVI